MKKSRLVFVPLLFVLASCETFTVGFTDDVHEAGVDHSTVSAYKEPSYPSYGGDQFTPSENENIAVITFSGIDDGLSNIQDIDKLNSFVTIDKEDFFQTIENPLNVGTKEGEGLFIGADSTYVDGEMTLVFKQNIKYVEILATPYYYVSHSWNDEKTQIDSDAGISVNGSPYIFISSSQNEDGSIKETNCRFLNYAQENKEKVTIKVGPKRALIKKITLYY